MKNQTIVIIGANSDIAKALALQVASKSNIQLIVISRDLSFYQQPLFTQALFKQTMFTPAQLISVNSYAELEITTAVAQIKQAALHNISQVYICHGVLHSPQSQPEKRLEDFSTNSFLEIITANTVTPMLWLKHLTPLLTSKNDCKVVIFTARVGSISDNKLGGWYSYRASKAAMNMLIKSAAVELSRRAKNIKLISFHPGTTDTPLSKPFQKNVPKGKLFTSEFVAKQLANITDATEVDGCASFVDWEGKEIPW
jgi:NAD(P)-dependent dehydrogenase (short-subunit alcohol dehydrogenase family)